MGDNSSSELTGMFLGSTRSTADVDSPGSSAGAANVSAQFLSLHLSSPCSLRLSQVLSVTPNGTSRDGMLLLCNCITEDGINLPDMFSKLRFGQN